MNPFRVDSLEAAAMAFGVGFMVAIIVTVVLHYSSGLLANVSASVAGTATG